jgi:integrase
VTRGPNGKQVWTTVGSTEVLPIAEARERARQIIQRVHAGLPAIEPRAQTFAAVVADWKRRHVEKNKLRSAHEVLRLIDRHLLPAWRDREFTGIRRSDVAALLDRVEDRNGARQADYVLAIARGIMNWYAARHDDYGPPIVRGMARRSAHTHQRARILGDDELRRIWLAAEAAGPFGGVVRLLLLTAQRRAKVIRMRWADISDDGVWTIAKESREKGSAGALKLPESAITIIRAQPRYGDNLFVFAGCGLAVPIGGISKFKAALVRASGVTGWRLHDLRRTARSLMARAGVTSEHAERVMGHAIAGVEGTYDRHSYAAEKAAALAKLAALIDAIVHPRGDRVVAIGAKRR